MLILRRPQVDAFGLEARRELEDRIVRIVARDYPQAYAELGDAGARQLAVRAIEVGAEHRVVTEGGVTVLAILMVQYGEGFERSPDAAWARGLLEHRTLPETLKIDMLLRRMAGRSQGRVVVPQSRDDGGD
jgi:hypothetical protein